MTVKKMELIGSSMTMCELKNGAEMPMNLFYADLYRLIVITCMKTLLQVIALRHKVPESISLRMQTSWLASGVDTLDGKKPDAHIV